MAAGTVATTSTPAAASGCAAGANTMKAILTGSGCGLSGLHSLLEVVVGIVLVVEVVLMVAAALRGRHREHKGRILVILVCAVMLFAPAVLYEGVQLVATGIGDGIHIGAGILHSVI